MGEKSTIIFKRKQESETAQMLTLASEMHWLYFWVGYARPREPQAHSQALVMPETSAGRPDKAHTPQGRYEHLVLQTTASHLHP